VKLLEIEQRSARLQQMGSTLSEQVTQLTKTMEQQNLENVQRKAILRGRIRKLEKELSER
jgi:hypothetical protein